LVLGVLFWLASPSPVLGQGLGDYFQISYNPVSFSKDKIEGSEVFQATITGRATCIKDLPLSVNEAVITSRIVAKHEPNGTEFTLNRYTIGIKPFPSKQGDTAEISESVPLAFPAGAKSGDYNIIGRLIKAEVSVGLGKFDVTAYLPPEQLMGSVSYTALAVSPTPTPTPTPTPVPQEYVIPWWVWLVVAAAGATTVANIIWYLRRRAY